MVPAFSTFFPVWQRLFAVCFARFLVLLGGGSAFICATDEPASLRTACSSLFFFLGSLVFFVLPFDSEIDSTLICFILFFLSWVLHCYASIVMLFPRFLLRLAYAAYHIICI